MSTDYDLLGPAESRILEVERRTVRLGDDLRRLQIAITTVRQGLWDDWAAWRVRAAVTPVAPAPPGTLPQNTTFHGQINGCSGLPLPGATVTVNPDGTGTETWTGTTASNGSYSGNVYISSSTSLPMTITPASSRLVVLTTTTGTLTPASNIAIATKSLTAADGYHCMVCPTPFVPSLHCVSDAGPGNPAPFTPFDLAWTSATPTSYWVGSSVFSSAGLTYTFKLYSNGLLTMNDDSGTNWTGHIRDCTNYILSYQGADIWAGITLTFTEN